MEAYFCLTLPHFWDKNTTLVEWRGAEGQVIVQGQELFSYQNPDQGVQVFSSSISGKLKAHLCKAKERLRPGLEIAVFKISKEQLKQALKNQLGVEIELEEAKQKGFADEATIRAPHEA